jgi:hypothetical protein
LQTFGKVNDQAELTERDIVDSANSVENQKAAEQGRKRKNDFVVVVVLVHVAKTFCVYYEHAYLFALWCGAWHNFVPHIKTIRASIGCVSNFEAVLLV